MEWASIRRLEEHVIDAQKELNEALHEMFPDNARIQWLFHDTHRQTGNVIRVSDDWWSEPQIIVRNDETLKKVTVYLHMRPERI